MQRGQRARWVALAWCLAVLLTAMAGCGVNEQVTPTSSSPSSRTSVTDTGNEVSGEATATATPVNTPGMIIAHNGPDPNATRVPSPPPTPTTVPAPVSVAYEFFPSDHLVETAPFDIPGYTLVRRLGSAAVPAAPTDVVVLSDGTTVVADSGTRQVLLFDTSGDRIPGMTDITLRTSGVQQLQLSRDAQDNIYVVTHDSYVERFTASGRQDADWSIDLGLGPGVLADPDDPQSVELKANTEGEVFVAVSSASDATVFRIDAGGTLRQVWTVDDCWWGGLAVAHSGDAYVTCDSTLLVLDDHGIVTDGAPPSQQDAGSAAVFWQDPDTVFAIESVASAPDGGVWLLFEGDPSGERGGDTQWLMHLDSAGNVLETWDSQVPVAAIDHPARVYIDDAHHIHVLDSQNGGVFVFDADGTLLHTLRDDDQPDVLTHTSAVAAAPNGDVFVLDMRARNLVHFAADGTVRSRHVLPDDINSPEEITDYASFALFGSMYWNLHATPDGDAVVLMNAPASLTRWSATGEFSSHQLLPEVSDDQFVHFDVDATGKQWLLISNDQDRNILLRSEADNPDVRTPLRFVIEAGDGASIAVSSDRVYITGPREVEIDGESLTFNSIHAFDKDGTDLGFMVGFSADLGEDGRGGYLEAPATVVTDSGGVIYTVTARYRTYPADAPGNLTAPDWMLRVFAPDGAPITGAYLTHGFFEMPSIDVSSDGAHLYITDAVNRQVLVYARDAE